MKKKENLFSEGKLKKRYKMYKAGKSWVVAPLVFAAFGFFELGVSPVKADQVETKTKNVEDMSVYTVSAPLGQQEFVLPQTDTSEAKEARNRATSDEKNQIQPDSSGEAVEQDPSDTTTSLAEAPTNDKEVASSTSVVKEMPASVGSASEQPVASTATKESLFVSETTGSVSSIAQVELSPVPSPSATTTPTSENTLVRTQVVSQKETRSAEAATFSQADSVMPKSLADQELTKDVTKVEAEQLQRIKTVSLLAKEKEVVAGASFVDANAQAEVTPSADLLGANGSQLVTVADVTTAEEFQKALGSNGIKTINLQADIDYGAKYSGTQWFDQIRDLTINGNGHQIDFNDAHIVFYTKSSQAMDLTLNDLTLYAYWGWGAFSINSKSGASYLDEGVKQTIKFNNVNYYGSQTVNTKTATVVLAGKSTFVSGPNYTSKFRNDVAVQPYQQNFELSALEIEPNAQITLQTDRGGNIYINNNGTPHFTVGKNATVNIIQTNDGTKSQGEKSSALIYTRGAVTFDEGSTVNIDIKNADRYRRNTDSVIYINNGSLTLKKGAVVTVGKNSDGDLQRTLIYLNGADSKIVLAENAQLKLTNEKGLKTTNDIYMYNGGVIRINGKGAKLDIKNSGDTDYGNVYIGGAGNVFVNDGGTLSIQNKAEKENTLLYTYGSATLSFGKGANVELKGSGAGKTTLITAASNSKISIYRPDDVTFDNTSAGLASKLFDFSGELKADFVTIQSDPTGAKVGPFKEASYLLDKEGTSNSTTANVIGLDQAVTLAGKNLANKLGQARFLQYSTDGMQNILTLADADKITPKTTRLSGTTSPDAYVTVNYYEDGQLEQIPGLNYSLTAPTETTPDYLVRADKQGAWVVELPVSLAADKILVASSIHNLTPAYKTAFVAGSKVAVDSLAAKAVGIAAVVEHAASQAQAVTLKASDVQGSKDRATSVATQASAYQSLATTELMAGSKAASYATAALQASLTASDAQSANDQNIMQSAASAQTSYAELATSEVGNATIASANAKRALKKVEDNLSALQSSATTFIKVNSSLINSNISKIVAGINRDNATLQNAQIKAGPKKQEISNAAEALNSAAKVLQEIARTDPTFKDEAQTKASQYTSEATTLLHELTANGSLEELRLVSDAYDQTLSAASEQASDFSKALSYYANGELSSAAQSIAQADSAGITEKVQALKQHSEALNEYMTGSFPKQVAALDSLTARANVASATAYIETTALQSKEQQAKIAQLFKAVIADKAALQATNAELVSLQEKLTKFTDGYPDDEKLTSVATVLNSVASQFAQTKAQMDTAESQASQATTEATKSLKNTENTKKIFEMQVQTDAKTAAEQLPGFMVTYSNEMKSALSLAELAGSLAKRASTAALTTLGSAKMALQEATKIFTENKTKEIAEQKKAVMQAVTEVANTQNEVTTQVTAVTSQAEQTQTQVDSAKTTLAQINEMTKEHLALPEVASEVAKAQSTAQVVSRAADRLAESARAAITAQSNVATMGSEARQASASVDNALSLAQSAATQARSLASQTAMQVALDSEASVASQAQVTAHEAVLSAQSSANKAEDVLTSLATLKLQTGNLAAQVKRAVTELALNKQKIQRALDLAAARSYAQLASTAASQAQVAETTAESELERARLAQSQATSSATEVNTLAGQTKELLAKVATIATKLSELTAPHADNTGFMHEVTQASNAAAKASLADQAISQATMLASSAASDASSAYQVASTAKKTVSLEASTASSAAKEATSYAVVGDKDHASSAASVASQAKNRATSADQTVSQATKQAQAAEKLASQAAQSALDAKMQASEALAKIETANSNALAYLAAGSYATKARQAFENTSTAAVQINEQATQVGQMFTKTNELLDAATENVAQTEMKTPQILALAKTASDLAAKYPAVEGLMAEATKASSAAMQASVAASAAQALTAQLQTLKQANAKHEQAASKAQQIASLAVSAASSANSVAISQAKLGAVLETKSAAKEATSASEQANEINQKVRAEVEQTRNSQVAADSLAKEAMTYASEASTLLLLADSAASQAERYVTALNQAKVAEEAATKVNTVKANVEKYLHQASEANSTAQVLTQTAKAKKETATEETARLASLVAELTQMASEHPQNSGVATILKEKTSLASTASVAVNQVNALATTAVSAAAEAMAKYPEVLAQANLSNSEASEATSVASAAQSFALKAAKEETDSLATVASEVATKAELTEQTAASAATKATSAAELTATTVEKMKVPQATLVQVLKTLQNAKTQAQQYLEAERYGLAALLAKEATLQASQAVDSAKGEVEQVASDTSTVAKKAQTQAEHSTGAETMLTSLAEQIASLASKYPTNASLEALSEHAAKTSEQANEAISEAVSVAAVASSAASVASEDHQAVRNAQLLASTALSEATSATVAAQSFASLGDVTKASSAASVASVAAKKAASAQQTALENTTQASQAAVSATEATTTAQQKQSLVANAVLELQELASQAKRYANALAQADLAASEADRADTAKSNATEQAEQASEASATITSLAEQAQTKLTVVQSLAITAEPIVAKIASLADKYPTASQLASVVKAATDAKKGLETSATEATSAASEASNNAKEVVSMVALADTAKEQADLAASNAEKAFSQATSYAVLGAESQATSATKSASEAATQAEQAKAKITTVLGKALPKLKQTSEAGKIVEQKQSQVETTLQKLAELAQDAERYANAFSQAEQAERLAKKATSSKEDVTKAATQINGSVEQTTAVLPATDSAATKTNELGTNATKLATLITSLAQEDPAVFASLAVPRKTSEAKAKANSAVSEATNALSQAQSAASVARDEDRKASQAKDKASLAVSEATSAATLAQSYAVLGDANNATSAATKASLAFAVANEAKKEATIALEQATQAQKEATRANSQATTAQAKATDAVTELNRLKELTTRYVNALAQAAQADKARAQVQELSTELKPFVSQASVAAQETLALATSTSSGADATANAGVKASELVKELATLASEYPDISELAKLSEQAQTAKTQFDTALAATRSAASEATTFASLATAKYLAVSAADSLVDLSVNEVNSAASVAKSYALTGAKSQATSLAHLASLSATKVNDVYVDASNAVKEAKLQFEQSSQAEQTGKTSATKARSMLEKLNDLLKTAKLYVKADEQADLAEKTGLALKATKMQVDSDVAKVSMSASEAQALAKSAGANAQQIAHLKVEATELTKALGELANNVAIPRLEELAKQALTTQKQVVEVANGADKLATKAKNTASDVMQALKTTSEVAATVTSLGAKATHLASTARSYAVLGDVSKATSVAQALLELSAEADELKEQNKTTPSQAENKAKELSEDVKKVVEQHDQVSLAVTQLAKVKEQAKHYVQAALYASSAQEEVKTAVGLKDKLASYATQASEAVSDVLNLAPKALSDAKKAQNLASKVNELVAQITLLATDPDNEQLTAQAKELQKVAQGALSEALSAAEVAQNSARETSTQYALISEADLLAKQAVAKAQSGADLAESYAALGNDSQALSVTTSVKKAGTKVSAAEAKARPSASQVMQNKQAVAKETRKVLQKEQQVDSVVTQLAKLLSDVTHYNQAKMQAQSLAELAKLQAAKLLKTDHTSQAYKAALAATSLASNTALVAEQAQTSSAQVPTLLAQITSLAEQKPADQKLAKFVTQANEAKLVVTSALQAITDANATTTHLASEAEKNYQATNQAEQDVRNAGAQVTSGASEAQSYALAGDLAQVKNVAKKVDLALSQAELASQTAKEAATKAQQNATDALTAAKVGQAQMVQLEQALAKLNELKADLADYAKARELAKEAKEIATNAQQAHVKSTEQVAQSAKEVAKIQALSAMTNELDTKVKAEISQVPVLVEAVTSAAQVYPEAVELADLSKEALSLQASGAMLASEVAESKTFASALDEEVQKLQRSAQTALKLASETTSEAVSTADVVQNHALTGTLAQVLSAAEHTSEATIKASDAEENTRALVEAVDHKGDMAESLAKETQAKKIELEQLLAKLSQLGTKAKQLLNQAKHTVQEKVVAEKLKATKGELANYLKLASEAVVKAQDKATQAKHDATKVKEIEPRMLLTVEAISSLAKTAPTNDGLQHLKALAQTIKADIFEVPKEAELTATEASVLAEATKKAYQAVREANLRVELAPNDPQKAFEALEKVKALTPKVVEQATKALQKAQSTQAKRDLFEQTLAQLEGMKAQAERYAQAEAKAHEIEATALEIKNLASASYASQASSAASVAKAATARTVTLASQIKALLKELKEDPTELMQVVTQLTTKASLVDLEATKDLTAVTQALSDFAQAKTTATNVAKEAVRAAKTGALEAVTSLATVVSEVAQKSAQAQQTAQTKAEMAGKAAKNAQALVSEMTKYLEQVKDKLATQTQAKENEKKTSLADQFQRKAQELADLSRTVTSYAKDLSLILSEADAFALKAQKSAKQTREAMALAVSLLTSMAQSKVSSLAEKQAQSIASTAKLTFKEFRLAQQQVTVVADEHRLGVTTLGMLEQALRKVDVEAKNDVSKAFELTKVIERALTKARKARLELQNVLAKAKEAKQNVVAHAQSAAEYEQQTLALLALLKNNAQTSAELSTEKQNQKETLSDAPNSSEEQTLKKESTKQSPLVLAQSPTKEEVAKRLQTSEVETRPVVLVKESAKKELAEVVKRPQTNETRKQPVALGKRPVQEKLGKVAELPQTGETKAQATPLSGLGVLSASLLGLLGLGKKRRKEK